jgi:hypothetical protein
MRTTPDARRARAGRPSLVVPLGIVAAGVIVVIAVVLAAYEGGFGAGGDETAAGESAEG